MHRANTYRFVLLACLISIGHSQCQRTYWQTLTMQPGYQWANSYESSALAIAQGVAAIDRKIQNFCTTYANHNMREVFGMDHYQLSVSISDFAEDNIAVKIMYRTIFVSAQDCSKTYADVKLLPEVVDPNRAVWKYWQGELVILIPYKVMQGQMSCGAFIDESVFIVPKLTTGAHGNCFAACGRSFGDGIIRDNVWHPSGTTGGFGQGAFSQGGFGHGVNNGNGGIIRNGVFGRSS